jgi:aminomethyltransferase
MERHRALGARFTDFGGWEMPLQYEGVVSEHHAVRESVGVFDVTHLGRFAVTGAAAQELVLGQLCNDIRKIGPGRAQYTMALNERGGVEDDIIVWQLTENDFWVMPNGVNSDEIISRFVTSAAADISVKSVRESTVLLAVQGPASASVIQSILGVVPGRFRVSSGVYEGADMVAAGTGYTGEPGVEIALPAAQAEKLLDDLLANGAVPCGLGARDTLRLEMGFPLWGQDLDDSTTPLEAGLSRVVGWDHEFIGRTALEQQRTQGTNKQLIAFDTGSRRIPRHGYPLRNGSSRGEVTSGNFSPVLGVGIGMGYLSPPPDDTGELEMKIRGSWLTMNRDVVPFIPR